MEVIPLSDRPSRLSNVYARIQHHPFGAELSRDGNGMQCTCETPRRTRHGPYSQVSRHRKTHDDIDNPSWQSRSLRWSSIHGPESARKGHPTRPWIIPGVPGGGVGLRIGWSGPNRGAFVSAVERSHQIASESDPRCLIPCRLVDHWHWQQDDCIVSRFT